MTNIFIKKYAGCALFLWLVEKIRTVEIDDNGHKTVPIF